MKIDRHTMTTADVARALGLSVERIRQIDDTLKPTRAANGQRRYDPKEVQRLVGQRLRDACREGVKQMKAATAAANAHADALKKVMARSGE